MTQEAARKHKKPEIVEVPEPAYRQPEPDVIVVDRVEAGDRALAFLESEAFYDAMQTYRHMSVGRQAEVVEAFEAVKKLIQSTMNAQERELIAFIADYVDTWKDAHPKGECARPSLCLVCRGRRLLAERGEKI